MSGDGMDERELDDAPTADAAAAGVPREDVSDVPAAKPAARSSALGRAIAAGRAGTSAGTGSGAASSSRRRQAGKRRRRDSRDPALLGDAVQDFVEEQGWQHASAQSTLVAGWTQIVGPELSEHLSVEALDEDRVLLLRASSTAWATNVSYLLPQLRQAIDAAVGPGVVADIKVRGPQAPSWSAGPRRVKGRGPRDTYG